MTDSQTRATGTMSSARLAQFEAEVGKLKASGGGANPDKLGSQWGIGLTIVGFVIAVIAFFSALDSSSTLSNLRSQIFAVIGVGVAIVGVAVWLRNSLTRYLRYWMIRLVYEQREQTDQLVEALRGK